MGKLMRVTVGSAFLVAVDIRKGSPTLGQWVGMECSAENRRMMWAPSTFARGFCALSDGTEVEYKCTGIYNADAESAIRWNDPAIGIKWPIADVNISQKDANALSLADWLASPESEHVRYYQDSEVESSVWS
jgi:dTDP-4-dehydrorhamnose 3,5-epimerase